MYQFSFPVAKQEEMAAQIKRYGTTTTGIGRIMAQMGRDRIWREPMVVELADPAQSPQHAEIDYCEQT